MKSRRSVDTELLYRGNHIPGIAELPDTPPIYHATAYAWSRIRMTMTGPTAAKIFL